MGFVGSIFGSDKGMGYQASGTALQEPVSTLTGEQATDMAMQGLLPAQQAAQQAAASNGFANQTNVFNQAQALSGQLSQAAQGIGPSVAQTMLANTTGQNVEQQAALMGSQRGANQNVGLMARQAAQRGAGIQQDAAGQAAVLRAQEIMGARQQLQQQQGLLGSIAGSQVGQQIGTASNYGQLTQGYQANVLNAIANANQQRVAMQGNINSANAGVQGHTADAQANIFSKVLGQAGTAMGIPGKAAEGGRVPDDLQYAPHNSLAMNIADPSSGTMTEYGQSGQPANQGTYIENTGNSGSQFLQNLALGGVANDFRTGGPVQGQAQVAGDSLKNDTVPAMLSPGEIVIPRSHAMDPDLAAEFARSVAIKNRHKYAQGGVVKNYNEGTPEEPVPQDAAEQSPSDDTTNQFLSSIKPGPPDISKDAAALSTPPAPATDSEQPSALAAVLGSLQKTPTQSQENLDYSGAGALSKDVKGAKEAEVSKGRAEAEVERLKGVSAQQQASKDEERVKEYSQNYKDYRGTRQEFIENLQNEKIDPDNYIKNMSGGRKVLTILGMILGGLGGSDAPLKYLQNEISNDMEAQKMKLGKEKTLLEANLQDFNTMNEASTMTHIMTNDMIAHKLLGDAAKSNSTIAMKNAQLAANKLGIQNDQPLAALELKNALLNKEAQKPGSVNPKTMAEYTVPNDEKKGAKTAIGEIDAIESLRKRVKEGYQGIDKLKGSGLFSPRQREAIINNLALPLMSIQSHHIRNKQMAYDFINSMMPGRLEGEGAHEQEFSNIDETFDTMRKKAEAQLPEYIKIRQSSSSKGKKYSNMAPDKK